MRTWRMPGRDRLALVAAFAAPLALAAILVPWRASFPNTDAALWLGREIWPLVQQDYSTTQ